MENYIAIVLILSTVSAPTVSQSTSESSEFMDPREPTFFEKKFFTALDMGARLSKKILHSVIVFKVLI